MGTKFGEVLIDLGYITQEQLDDALELQKRGRAKLGVVMVYMNLLTNDQVDEILNFQWNNPGILFGEAAVKLKFIDAKACTEAIRYQTNSKGFLGELLIELGYITEEQRLEATQQQILY